MAVLSSYINMNTRSKTDGRALMTDAELRLFWARVQQYRDRINEFIQEREDAVKAYTLQQQTKDKEERNNDGQTSNL